MGGVRVISTSTIKVPNHNDGDPTHKIDLTPWDLQLLPFEAIQKGLLFRFPADNEIIEYIKHTISSALAFFPPLGGRLIITEHEDDNTVSCFIACNNVGVLFVHATADNTSVDDILQPNYVPPIVRSFFPLNGVKNCEGTSQPLLGVQVTVLLDGIFIGCTVNHVVADGTSFTHMVNSWAEVFRGCPKISKPPSLERWFPNGIERPIRFPFTTEAKKQQQQQQQVSEKLNDQPERIFHFKKEKIAQLKSKANAEAGTNKISSLQALFSHLWRSVIRCKQLDPQEEVHYVLTIGVRHRMTPALPEDYFGNAIVVGGVTMTAGELLQEGGLGKGAWEMNTMIALESDEKLKNNYESWSRSPKFITVDSMASSNSLVTSISPWFNVYGNDFGWVKPVAVRSGGANKRNGKISVSSGAEEGSIDLEVCLPYEILEAMGNDLEFMEAVSS